jgi:hypothetical protein
MIMVIRSENFIKVNMASSLSSVLGSTTVRTGAVVMLLKQIVDMRGTGQRVNSGGSKK